MTILFSINETCEKLGLTNAELMNMVLDNKIGFLQIGTYIYISHKIR